MKLLAFLVWLSFMGLLQLPQASAEQPADSALYGPYPTNYKEIVTKWLETQLLDPNTARIEWTDEPDRKSVV